MNLLHDYIAAQLAEHVARRKLVVWFDPRREFADFVNELERDETGRVMIDGSTVGFHTYAGSFLELRISVEPVMGLDSPPSTVVYLPGVERNHTESVLMELECAGDRWEPQLKRLARNALRAKFTDGVIDELLARDDITYQDLVSASADTSSAEPPSMLKTILGLGSSESIIARWLLDEAFDTAIVEKQAQPELSKLINARLDLETDPGAPLTKNRSVVARYVLATEFRSDLTGSEPTQLHNVPVASVDATRNAREIAIRMRTDGGEAYVPVADRAETELSLSDATIDPLTLGAIDTFRFEERALLDQCMEMIRNDDFEAVMSVVEARQRSFWLDQDVERRAQWEVCRRMAELGTAAQRISRSVQGMPADPDTWVERYADDWHVVDQAQRRLEALIPKLEEEPDQRALVSIRSEYDTVLTKLAAGFAAALGAKSWSVERTLHQTEIYESVVKPLPGRVAYFFVDAMRYEMGVELAALLQAQSEVSIQPALSVLPSITVTGMAALMPGAASSYSVVEDSGKLGARIDSSFLSGIRDRQRLVEGRLASSTDTTLGEVLMKSKAQLKKKVGHAQIVIVRSQEIDHFGEGGFEARQVMGTVIENIARAVRRLSALGIERAVITADHGHLYSAEDRDESQRIDAPGGATVELHRRCWIGRGGTTPNACIRVPASKLGNDSDLDLVFPVGIGVFKAGGDLAFHHGGPTLQEMVIPVVTVHTSPVTAVSGLGAPSVAVTGEPESVTNRIFSVQMSLATLLGSSQDVLPALMSGGVQVGSVGMVVGAEYDRSTGAVTLTQSGTATIGFVLDDDSATSLRIVVLDPATDAELYRSTTEIPVQLGVA